ncbi:quinone-dependent dihydroorotate dehydrogenase [Tropicimonas marinistellae]|uniref:quinone-dependent dihydroorotate dehydrogenase n=1 Tax=Tropicimonas marinistellae TaxID=1739787 RepID=UPI00082B1367|nr:quinone-dependent dihydroorotate dehydrogenase [Tropicimonas marinistellae]
MSWVERIGMAAFHRMDPELAHGLSLKALNAGLARLPGPITSARLRTRVAGLDLPNPVGLAAGLDKNAIALGALAKAGFGFLEVGATTPRPQPGNPKPRLFRLPEDRAVINRFGFNNDGMTAMAARLENRPPDAVVGLNLGANKDSADRAADFAQVLETCGPRLDFATVNVSSPNTENLRDLQGKAALEALLRGVLTVRDGLDRPIPIFVKIAPDLSDAEIADVATVAGQVGIDGIIATNTTLARDGLKSDLAHEKGGLSGVPLFEKSTAVLARLRTETAGTIPLIGVGGIASGADAYAKIRAGASAVQLYSALVYGGIGLVAQIVADLDTRLAQDGFASVSEAVGTAP